jgi:putative FmdB family regulatory protein
MPIYEFRCERCGHQFEELIYRRQEASELTCPKCGEPVVRLLSSFTSSGAAKASGSTSGCGGGSFS